MSWTCDTVTNVCTLSPDLAEAVHLLVQAAWLVAGALIGTGVVLSFALIARRIG